jgi:transposase, IS5 family
VAVQPALWDSILPPELLVLPVELGRVVALLEDDALLEDPVFVAAPFAPMETYRSRHA